MVVIQRISQAQTLTHSKKIYHISDEFFKEVFQKFLWGEQRGLVQLLLPQVIVVMHRLPRNMKDKVSVWHSAPVNDSTKIQKVDFLNTSGWYPEIIMALTHIRAQSMSTAACVTPLLFRFKAFTVFTPNFSLNLENKLIHICRFLLKNEARHTNTWRYTQQIWIYLKKVWGWIHKEFIASEVACCFFSTWSVQSFTQLLSSNIKEVFLEVKTMSL